MYIRYLFPPHRPDLQKRKPFCFVVVWCNTIADKGKKVIQQWADTWSGTAYAQTVVTVPSSFDTLLFSAKVPTQDVYVQVGADLWHGLNDADDASQHWLERVEVFFVEAGTNVEQRLNVPKDRVTIADGAHGTFGGHRLLRIQLQHADMQGVKRRVFGQIQGKVRVRVIVRTVVGWTFGFSVPGINLLVVADKAEWERCTDALKDQVLNHELGHKIGMTAQGGKLITFNSENAANTPNAPASLYGNDHPANARQGTGNHCGSGAAWTGAYWTGTPSCVLFGNDRTATGGQTPKTYCGDCEPIVRKLDLSNTMVGFKRCVTD